MTCAPAPLLLLGPTASGKSALALELARDWALEIVVIDSAQVYRGLDIGSAKPSAAERALVPHHLIDLRDPSEPYSAAEFVRDARAAIAQIQARGRLPLIVGGSMLYARVLKQGIAALPGADPRIRASIEAQARRVGWPALHARLMAVDPVLARRLAPADRQRIARALEVFESTGRALSQLQGATPPQGIDLRTIALMPLNRAALHQRIEARFDAMLAQGFIDEVRALRARGDLHADLPALRSVGYRQAWEYLELGSSFVQFRAAAIAATRQLARRQLTWLRSMTDAISIDPFGGDAARQLAQALHTATPLLPSPVG